VSGVFTIFRPGIRWDSGFLRARVRNLDAAFTMRAKVADDIAILNAIMWGMDGAAGRTFRLCIGAIRCLILPQLPRPARRTGLSPVHSSPAKPRICGCLLPTQQALLSPAHPGLPVDSTKSACCARSMQHSPPHCCRGDTLF